MEAPDLVHEIMTSIKEGNEIYFRYGPQTELKVCRVNLETSKFMSITYHFTDEAFKIARSRADVLIAEKVRDLTAQLRAKKGEVENGKT